MSKLINCIIAYGAIVMEIKACEYYFNFLATLTILCLFVLNKDHYMKTKSEWFDKWSEFKMYFNQLVAWSFLVLFLFNNMILPAIGYLLVIGIIGVKHSAYKELKK